MRKQSFICVLPSALVPFAKALDKTQKAFPKTAAHWHLSQRFLRFLSLLSKAAAPSCLSQSFLRSLSLSSILHSTSPDSLTPSHLSLAGLLTPQVLLYTRACPNAFSAFCPSRPSCRAHLNLRTPPLLDQWPHSCC